MIIDENTTGCHIPYVKAEQLYLGIYVATYTRLYLLTKLVVN